MRKTKRYCVVYRTGTPDNFRWNRSLPHEFDAARDLKTSMDRVEIHCLLEDYDRSVSLGLPDTFTPESRK